MSDELVGPGDNQPVVVAITSEMIRLYKMQLGRGPSQARTYWCGEDMLTCVLFDTLTPAEMNMLRLGEHQRLRDMRTFMQYASAREFCEPVERITGRRVRAFISGIDTYADGVCTETFLLHPPGSTAASRSQEPAI